MNDSSESSKLPGEDNRRRSDALSLASPELKKLVKELQDRLADAEKVVRSAQEWDLAQKWSHENAKLMVSSIRTSEDAGLIMDNFFSKQTKLFQETRRYGSKYSV